MRRTFIIITLLLGTCLSPDSSLAQDKATSSLKEVFRKVREGNAEIKALEQRLEGLAAISSQAKQLPNPELNFETENFSGDRDGFTETENTVTISQKIELGGKRGARARNASANESLAKAKMKLKLCELLENVYITYAETLLSQTRLSLAKEQEGFSRRILSSVREKVKLGGSLQGEQTKAEIALNLAKLDVRKLESELVQNKLKLSSFWHGDLTEIGQLSNLEQIETTLDLEKVDDFPLLALETLRVESLESTLETQKALAVPDVTIQGGYRRFEDTNEDAFVGGFSLPLNIFNRNKGSIKNASKTLESVRIARNGKKQNLINVLKSLQESRNILLEEHNSLNKTLLPNSKNALSQIQKAYQLGRVGYLDLSDSWRIYFETRSRAAQNSYQQQVNQAKISSLTGQILNIFGGGYADE